MSAGQLMDTALQLPNTLLSFQKTFSTTQHLVRCTGTEAKQYPLPQGLTTLMSQDAN